MTRFGLIAALTAFSATPVLADQVTGDVLAFDRVAQIIVLDDKSVWSLKDGGADAPDTLEAGQTITIDFQTVSDNGYGKITRLTIAE